MEEEVIPQNDTLAALLRKLEDGDFINHAGAKVQQLLADLRGIASRKGSRAVGTITITIRVPMGKDGSALPVGDITCKKPKVTRDESLIFVDEDGDLIAKPVEKQLSLKMHDGGAPTAAKDPAKPASKGL